MTATADPTETAEAASPRRPAWLTRFLGFGLLGVTLVGFLGAWHWGLDLLSHARLQYAFLAIPVLLIGLVARDRVVLTLGVLALVINAGQIAPMYLGSTGDPALDSDRLRVLTFNVFDGNRDFEGIIDVVETSGADIVFVHEMGRGVRQALTDGLDGYEFAMEDGWGFASGSGALVRTGMDVTPTTLRAGPSGRYPTVSFEFEGENVDVVGVHPPSPTSPGRTRSRDRTLEDIALWARSRPGEVVVAGDFNASPFSSAYRSFETMSDLTSSIEGAGWQPTWPDGPAFLQIPIDHAFVSDGLAVTTRAIGPRAGSDHASLVIEIATAAD